MLLGKKLLPYSQRRIECKTGAKLRGRPEWQEIPLDLEADPRKIGRNNPIASGC